MRRSPDFLILHYLMTLSHNILHIPHLYIFNVTDITVSDNLINNLTIIIWFADILHIAKWSKRDAIKKHKEILLLKIILKPLYKIFEKIKEETKKLYPLSLKKDCFVFFTGLLCKFYKDS